MTKQQEIQTLSDVYVLLNKLQINGSSAEDLVLCKQAINKVMQSISIKLQEEMNSEGIHN